MHAALTGVEACAKVGAAMLDIVRTSLHRVITTPVGDGFLPLRLPKDLARRVNMMLGKPICDAAELERRRAARERLEQLRATAGATGAQTSSMPRVAAPVMVYFENDRNVRLLGRIRETLDSRGIAYTELDVAGDVTTKNYVMREARCKEDDLPIVFVAAAPVGGYNDLVEWDVSGKLASAVYGEGSGKRDVGIKATAGADHGAPAAKA